MVHRTAPFSTTPTADFKVMPWCHYLTLNVLETLHRRSFNWLLIGTLTRSTEWCHFQWPWLTLSDLWKYSTTQTVARSLRQLSYLFFYMISVAVLTSVRASVSLEVERVVKPLAAQSAKVSLYVTVALHVPT